MKKIVLYFITSIAAIWFIDLLLSGFVFGGTTTVFLVDLFIVAGIYLTEKVVEKIGKKSNTLVFLLIGILLNFFSLYFASLFLGSDFSVGSGSLSGLEIGFLTTPIIKSMDQILTLLLGSLIAMLITIATKWATESKAKKSE